MWPLYRFDSWRAYPLVATEINTLLVNENLLGRGDPSCHCDLPLELFHAAVRDKWTVKWPRM